MSAHAPGPWRAVKIPSPGGRWCVETESGSIVLSPVRWVDDDGDEAICRLAAAAPDMLLEIKYSVAVYRGLLEGDDLDYAVVESHDLDYAVVEAQLESALQAIALAEGSS